MYAIRSYYGHLRFFTEPVPACIQFLEKLDGFLQIGLPGLMLSGVALLAGVTFLFLRRIWIPQVKYISLGSDYFVITSYSIHYTKLYEAYTVTSMSGAPILTPCCEP